MRYKVYLFDFDGTLFNTEAALKFIFQESFSVVGIEIKDEEVMEISRQPFAKTFAERNGDYSKGEEFGKKLVELVHSQRSIDLTYPYEETFEVLKALKDSGALLGVVTSNNARHVREVMAHTGLPMDTFDVIVGNDEFEKPKPNAEPILNALKMLNYKGDKTDVVYVGDGLNDALAAVNAEVNPILLDRNNEYPNSEYVKITNLKELK